MPSFRDLRGRAVEDVVTSRDVPPEADLAERHVVQAAVEKVRQHRGEALHEKPYVIYDPDTQQPPEPRHRLAVAVSLPEDFEAGLAALEATLAVASEHTAALVAAMQQAQTQILALRQRAEVDADRLARLDAIRKALE